MTATLLGDLAEVNSKYGFYERGEEGGGGGEISTVIVGTGGCLHSVVLVFHSVKTPGEFQLLAFALVTSDSIDWEKTSAPKSVLLITDSLKI